ncbi:uncharacterized protein C7orf50 homolog [Pieris rapae]|uniref:uncharacterized protein C7orf50 homolog n=1 Tax=Pieris rapae TaxID=64459 RepID=UPI001E27A374|nr:uncharacterized protein C7orf50 homolog [Pieris rapae]
MRKIKKNKEKNSQTEITKESEIVDTSTNEIEDNVKTALNSEDYRYKRPLEDHDSDSGSEVKSKKPKKKKKQVAPVEGTTENGKKQKKSIRQMKKERHAQRQAEVELAAKDQLKSQCLNYLSQWKHDKQNWKFMKAKQVWLYKNKFSKQLLPENSWPLLLEYFESSQGNIRKMLLDDANKIIKQMDDWTESQGKNSDNDADETNLNKPDDVTYNRARNLIQCLQE